MKRALALALRLLLCVPILLGVKIALRVAERVNALADVLEHGRRP